MSRQQPAGATTTQLLSARYQFSVNTDRRWLIRGRVHAKQTVSSPVLIKHQPSYSLGNVLHLLPLPASHGVQCKSSLYLTGRELAHLVRHLIEFSFRILTSKYDAIYTCTLKGFKTDSPPACCRLRKGGWGTGWSSKYICKQELVWVFHKASFKRLDNLVSHCWHQKAQCLCG